jgi:phosphoesterase RecJ-like protein
MTIKFKKPIPDSINEIFYLIETSKKILIATHENPEGDAISSAISMAMFLEGLDKEVYLYDKDPIPLNLRFLPWSKRFSQKLPEEPIDLLVVLDCGELERIGPCGSSFGLKSFSSAADLQFDGSLNNAGSGANYKLPSNAQANLININRIINIDHHWTNNNFGHANLVIPDASSTGEVLFYLFVSYAAKENNIPYAIHDELSCVLEDRNKLLSRINDSIAKCLYTSILTDTGSFRYSSANKYAFYIASILNQYNIEPPKIAEELYETKPVEQLKLLSKSLGTLELVLDGRVASMIGTKKMLNDVLNNNDYVKGISLYDSFVNYPRSINGVEIAIFFKEINFNEYKLSFRAKSYANVAYIAEKFGGGGHKFAAGCKINGDINEVKKEIYGYCKEVL